MATWLRPVVKSMVVCEDVLPGPEGTGNVHLMNVFSSIRPRAEPLFPHRHPQVCVFLQLTDAEGRALGQIIARQQSSGSAVFGSARHVINFRDRLQVKWALFRLQDCPFPEPGLYSIEFHCAGRWLFEQSVALVE
jgi:hypothetical protein